jgi:hypothetical protein
MNHLPLGRECSSLASDCQHPLELSALVTFIVSSSERRDCMTFEVCRVNCVIHRFINDPQIIVIILGFFLIILVTVIRTSLCFDFKISYAVYSIIVCIRAAQYIHFLSR